jgi:hypothetical protein
MKTAGTSFKFNFLNNVYEGRYKTDNLFKKKLRDENWKRTFNKDWVPLIDLEVEERVEIDENVDVIFGHFRYFKYDDLNWPYVTFVRDPIERLISAYCYYARLYKDNIGIRDFAKIFPNHMTYVLGSDLNKYKFVGITERFDESLYKFCKLFDIPWKKKETKRERVNVGFKTLTKKDLSTKDIDYLISLNEKDYDLYNKALKL